MTETREQRIERWAIAGRPFCFDVRPTDGPGTRAQLLREQGEARKFAEAIDASNTAAGLVLVDRNVVMKVLHAWDDIYNHRTPTGPDLIHCLDALRKEIEG